MKKDGLSRRQFNTLTAAAFGGIVTGTIAGCGGKKDKDGTGKDGKPKDGAAKDSAGKDGAKVTPVAANPWTGDAHVCRGLNACKGKGAGGDNACAGQGNCATAEKHTCHKENACKYQGGCGESVGNNACKTKGECAVPLSDKAWTKARTSFEAAMKKAEKKFGDAPAKKAG